jgi:predicted transcriptional regulator
MGGKMSEVKFTLLENALDFIEEAIENLDRKPEKLKYSVLNLSAGVELIMKVVLQQEHWSLLFKKTEEADYEKLISGDFNSVDSQTAINRIEKICRIELSDEIKKVVKRLRELRNRIEHFHFEVSIQHMNSILFRTLFQVINIIENEINGDLLTEEDERKISEIKEAALEFEDFLEEKYKSVMEAIKSYKENDYLVMCCPSCRYDSIIIDGGSICLVCDYEPPIGELGVEYIEEVLGISAYECGTNGGEFPLYECPECEVEALVVDQNIKSEAFCTFCGSKYSIDEIGFCENCGTCVHGTDNFICKRCVEIAWEE